MGLKEQIAALAMAAAPLDPDAAARARLLDAVTALGDDYLARVPTAPAHVTVENPGAGLHAAPISENGIGIDAALRLLDEQVLANGINPTSGRFLGYIPGGGLYHAALGDYLAALTNRYAGIFFASPGAVRMENMLWRWMAEVTGLPDSTAGVLSSGGSLANLSAVVTARDAAGIEGADVGRAVAYLTDHSHHCLDKALHVAGLRGCVVRRVAVDERYRMQPTALAAAIAADRRAGLHPWLVVANAGSTNAGMVDPLDELGQIAAAHDLWYHVDGAYGGFFVLCDEGRAALAGMNRADSLVMDPHKTLFLPYGLGALLVRDGRRLLNSFGADADYIDRFLDDPDELSPADLSPELTRHWRGLRLWLPLQIAGVGAFRAALAEKLALARYFYEEVQRIPGFIVGPAPDLSVVTYHYRPVRGDADTFNQRLLAAIQTEGDIFLSGTRLDGRITLRAAIGCFRTHLDDVEAALEALRRAAAAVADSA